MRNVFLQMYSRAALGVFALVVGVLGAFPVQAADRTPLLMEGKKTLYQRVIAHPGCALRAGNTPEAAVTQPQVRPFTVFYVYARQGENLEVGVGPDKADGWVQASKTTPWKQALTLLFSDRSRREPVLFFGDRESLVKTCNAPDLAAELKKLRAGMGQAAAPSAPEGPIVAAEPADTEGSASGFYLMPILNVDRTFEATQLLEVASIAPAANDKKAPQDTVGRTGIALVMDTTISMKPYIEQSMTVVRSIFDAVEKDKLTDRVGFGIVAFRNSTKASPGLEYLTRVVSDFRDASQRKELEQALSGVEEAKVSTHSFNEDSLAGVKVALEQLDWQPYANRVILLLTDAGPLPLSDTEASTSLDVREMADLAASKNVRIVVVHVRTPLGKDNIDYASKAYTALSAVPGGKSAYIPIVAQDGTVGSQAFARAATGLSTALVASARQTQPLKPSDKPAGQDPEALGKQLGEQLGYSMRLEYMGRMKHVQAPQVVRSWIADADLDALNGGTHVASVSVAVLLTRNQLSDLQQRLKVIVDNAERTRQTDSRDFFQGILSASAGMARDPGAFSRNPSANLGQLGVLGEFLDDLPYKSDIMLLSEDDWYRMSVGEQTSFINRLKSRIARYEEYDRDVNNWESFGAANSGDWVYRVPLAMLP